MNTLLRCTTLVASLASFACPAAAQTLGPPLSVGRRVETAPSERLRPDAIARDGSAYVFAYSDESVGAGHSKLARVSGDGTGVVGLGPILPAVLDLACHDGICLAVGRRSGSGITTIIVTRFHADTGALIDIEPIALHGPLMTHSSDVLGRVDVVEGGFAVATGGLSSTLDVHFVPTTGPASPGLTGLAMLRSTQFDIACGDVCLVTWVDALGMHAQRVTADASARLGTVLDLADTATSPWANADDVRAVFDGTSFRIAANVWRADDDARGFTVSTAGVVEPPVRLERLDSGNIACTETGHCVVPVWEGGFQAWRGSERPVEGGFHPLEAVACGATTCLGLFEGRTPFGRVISTEPISEGPLAFGAPGYPDRQNGPMAVGGGLVAFQRYVDGMDETVVVAASSLGSASPTEHVIYRGESCVSLSLASDHGRYALVRSIGDASSALSILSPAGEALGAPIPLPCETSPHIAWHGDVLGVACGTRTAVVLQRRSAAGTLLGSTTLTTDAWDVDVAASRDGWRVVVERRGQVTGYNVSLEGVAGAAITLADETDRRVRVVPLTRGHAIAWIAFGTGMLHVGVWPEGEAALTTEGGSALGQAYEFALGAWGARAYVTYRMRTGAVSEGLRLVAFDQATAPGPAVDVYDSAPTLDVWGSAVGGDLPLLVYAAPVRESGLALIRARAHRIEVACTEDADCAFGTCTEGVCACDDCHAIGDAGIGDAGTHGAGDAGASTMLDASMAAVDAGVATTLDGGVETAMQDAAAGGDTAPPVEGGGSCSAATGGSRWLASSAWVLAAWLVRRRRRRASARANALLGSRTR